MEMETPYNPEKRPVPRLTTTQLAVMRRIDLMDPKWSDLSSVVINDVPVDSGLIDVEIDGSLITIDTARDSFGKEVSRI